MDDTRLSLVLNASLPMRGAPAAEVQVELGQQATSFEEVLGGELAESRDDGDEDEEIGDAPLMATPNGMLAHVELPVPATIAVADVVATATRDEGGSAQASDREGTRGGGFGAAGEVPVGLGGASGEGFAGDDAAVGADGGAAGSGAAAVSGSAAASRSASGSAAACAPAAASASGSAAASATGFGSASSDASAHTAEPEPATATAGGARAPQAQAPLSTPDATPASSARRSPSPLDVTSIPTPPRAAALTPRAMRSGPRAPLLTTATAHAAPSALAASPHLSAYDVRQATAGDAPASPVTSSRIASSPVASSPLASPSATAPSAAASPSPSPSPATATAPVSAPIAAPRAPEAMSPRDASNAAPRVQLRAARDASDRRDAPASASTSFDAAFPAAATDLVAVGAPTDLASAPVTASPATPASVAAPPPSDRSLTPGDSAPTLRHDLRADLRRGASGRLREVAAERADLHALSRAVDAEVDLGDAGRIAVAAREPHGAVEVRLEADTREIASVLARNAGELVSDLARSAPDVRVTIGGPSSSQTWNGGGPGSRSSDREEKDGERRGAVPDAPRAAARRVRIVL